jgi:hypothetical protein
MLGRIAVDIAAAALTPQKPARRTPPKPAGWIGCLGIVACVAAMVYGDASGKWTVTWFVVLPLVCAAFIAAGCIVSAIRRDQLISSAVTRLPGKPRVTTAQQMRERAAQLVRYARVAGLLTPACPLCSSAPGVSCRALEDYHIYALDAERDLYVHAARIGRAVRTGAASARDVTAQFSGGLVPDEIWASAL